MKINKFMAALCAVTLLTGCGDPTGNQYSSQSSSAYTSHYSEESSSSTAISSTETSETAYSSSSAASSKQMSSASTSSKSNEIIKDTLKPWVGLIYDSEQEGKNMVEYYYRIEQCNYNYTKVRFYVSQNEKDIGRIIGEFKHDPASYPAFFAALTPGTNYYRVQLIGNNVESQISDPYKYTKAGSGSGTASVKRYTHTFTAPSYLTVIPDYSDALAMIEQGKEPDSFSVSVQFTCPGCGTKRMYNVWLVQFPYSSDGKMPFTAECGLTSCPYRRNRFSTTIESHAVRVS